MASFSVVFFVSFKSHLPSSQPVPESFPELRRVASRGPSRGAMFKAMAKLTVLGVSVGGRHKKGPGAGSFGSDKDLAQPTGAGEVDFHDDVDKAHGVELPLSLQEWSREGSAGIDPANFAAQYYGDAGEPRIARLHAVLSTLRDRADEEMRANVLANHALFVNVGLEIGRLTHKVNELRTLVAIPSDAVDAMLHEAEREAEATDDNTTKRGDGTHHRNGTQNRNGFDSEKKLDCDGVRAEDVLTAEKLLEELESRVWERAPHAVLDTCKRTVLFVETIRAGKTATAGKNTNSEARDRVSRCACLLTRAVDSAMRAATEMLVNVVGDAREDHFRRAGAILALRNRFGEPGKDAARRSVVSRAANAASTARLEAERAERTLSILTLTEQQNSVLIVGGGGGGGGGGGTAYVPTHGPGFALRCAEDFCCAARIAVVEMNSIDDDDRKTTETPANISRSPGLTRPLSVTAKLWVRKHAFVPFAETETDAFADSLAKRSLLGNDSTVSGADETGENIGGRVFENASSEETESSRFADARFSLDLVFSHLDAFATECPSIGKEIRRRICGRGSVKNAIAGLMRSRMNDKNNLTKRNQFDKLSEMAGAYANATGDDAVDALRAFAVT